jgi:hypothetical protein
MCLLVVDDDSQTHMWPRLFLLPVYYYAPQIVATKKSCSNALRHVCVRRVRLPVSAM